MNAEVRDFTTSCAEAFEYGRDGHGEFVRARYINKDGSYGPVGAWGINGTWDFEKVDKEKDDKEKDMDVKNIQLEDRTFSYEDLKRVIETIVTIPGACSDGRVDILTNGYSGTYDADAAVRAIFDYVKACYPDWLERGMKHAGLWVEPAPVRTPKIGERWKHHKGAPASCTFICIGTPEYRSKELEDVWSDCYISIDPSGAIVHTKPNNKEWFYPDDDKD